MRAAKSADRVSGTHICSGRSPTARWRLRYCLTLWRAIVFVGMLSFQKHYCLFDYTLNNMLTIKVTGVNGAERLCGERALGDGG